MKGSEARNLMLIEKECINRDCDRDCANCNIVQTVDNLNEAYDMAIEALEKQMPKKPDFTEDKEFALCPCCNGKGLADKQIYCDNCGQKLDWSDVE